MTLSDAAPTIRIGVALGGGSARGYAHIGALASLERNGIAPHVIAGSSFGAVVGALYALGRSPGELTDEASRLRRRDVFPHIADFGLHKAALFDGVRLEAYFERLVEGRRFEDLVRELVIVATDVDSGERVLLREGPLAPALRASASLPGIFAPVTIGGRRLIDGGVGSPVPLDTLESMGVDLAIGLGAGVAARDSQALRTARHLLATRLGRRMHGRLGSCRADHPVSRLGRALAIVADSWLVDGGDRDRLELNLRPPIHWLNFHRADEAIRAGAEALEQFMPRIRSQLALLTPAL